MAANHRDGKYLTRLQIGKNGPGKLDTYLVAQARLPQPPRRLSPLSIASTALVLKSKSDTIANNLMNHPILGTERVLCFGGSFNPIHHGHLITARAVAEAGGFNRVLLIPSSQPPHKRQNGDIADAEQRLTMCQLAVAGDSLFDVSDLELRRSGPSYTIDTVRELKRQGWRQVHWLMGADMVEILPKWHEPQALLAEAEFVVMARPGWSFNWDGMPVEFRRLQQNVVATPQFQISATEIRQRVRAGRSIRYLVPEGVRGYIEQNRLYAESRA